MNPTAVFGVLGTTAVGFAVYVGMPWRWFSYHPLLMLLAHLALASAGIAAKRAQKGRANTMLHAGAMVLATALSLGGWYVIYQQKVMLGKPHNMSYHSWAGLVTLCAFCLLSVGGVLGLHPDFGILKATTRFRTAHRLGGRAAAAASFVALASGTAKLTGTAGLAALCTLCAGVAWFLLLGAGPAGAGATREEGEPGDMTEQLDEAGELLPTI